MVESAPHTRPGRTAAAGGGFWIPLFYCFRRSICWKKCFTGSGTPLFPPEPSPARLPHQAAFVFPCRWANCASWCPNQRLCGGTRCQRLRPGARVRDTERRRTSLRVPRLWASEDFTIGWTLSETPRTSSVRNCRIGLATIMIPTLSLSTMSTRCSRLGAGAEATLHRVDPSPLPSGLPIGSGDLAR
jgi:hypothetical protein